MENYDKNIPVQVEFLGDTSNEELVIINESICVYD